MQMDSNIILSGRSPDLVGAMDRGALAAGNVNGIRRQNALADVYRTQGAGIMAGDPGALNALAAFDPQAALGIQQTRQGMQADQQRMDMLSREEQRQIAEHAANMSAAERAEAAAQVESAVKAGLAIQDPQTWDAYMSQNAPDLVGQFGNRQMIANRYMSIADIIKGQAPESLSDRFKVVGSQLVDLAAQGGPQAVITAPGQEEVIFGPDGKPILSRGPVGSAAKFTESQSKDITFSTRARGALADLESGNPSALSGRVDTMLDSLPLGFGREIQSPEYQQAQTAGQEFLQAILRKDTGAAITEQEQTLYGQTYLPQPGDGPERLAQKKAARERALLAMEAGMSPDAIIRQEQALSTQGVGGNVRRIEIDGFTIEALD